MNGVDQSIVGDVQECHARGFVDSSAFCLDDSVFNLIAETESVPATDFVGDFEEFCFGVIGFAIDSYWPTF